MRRKPIPLIAFTGGMQSGKTTAAKGFRKNLGFALYSFADPIRKVMRALGVPNKNLNSDKDLVIPEFGASARWMMQSFGTEWGRTLINDRIWLDMMSRRLLTARKEGKPVVIDDVRFDNEAELVLQQKGIVIKLERGDAPTNAHESEMGVSDGFVTIVIENEGSVTDLYTSTEEIAHDGSLLPR